MLCKYGEKNAWKFTNRLRYREDMERFWKMEWNDYLNERQVGKKIGTHIGKAIDKELTMHVL